MNAGDIRFMESSTRPDLYARVDPITLQVMNGRMQMIVDEMLLTLLKSSYSTIVTEGGDTTAALFDRYGRTIAQAVSIPIHLGACMDIGLRVSQKFPKEVAREGDLYIVNDPYSGGTHLPDIGIIAPIFAAERLVGYAMTMTHHQDVGGTAPGSCATNAFDHLSEGLHIPMIHLASAGNLNHELIELMQANSRSPKVMKGDLFAQISACRNGERQFEEFVLKHGEGAVYDVIEALISYSEWMTRQEIAAIPDGTYEFADWLDNDGVSAEAEPVSIRVKMVVRGSDIHFDFTGTSPQVKGAVNNVPSSAMSAIFFTIRNLTGEEAPNNNGCFLPISVYLPQGTIVNPDYPAPVAARGVCSRRITDVVQGVMAKAVPARMHGADCGQSSIMHVGGTYPETNERFVGIIGGPWMGGMGARADKDGVDVTDHGLSNVYHIPIEITEGELPLRFEELRLWEGSGGAGKWRGGLGFVAELEWLGPEATVSIRRERHKFAPWGIEGGLDGPYCKTQIHRAHGEILELPSKCVVSLNNGDRLKYWTTGSGGYGEPTERDPQLVLQDVLDERVSTLDAERIYGVAISESRVDENRTSELRKQMTEATTNISG